jgi:hypothetical protein
MATQDTWRLRRAYTPGYIVPGGACFGARPGFRGCFGTVTARWREQKMAHGPQWGMSPHVAVRWNEATAAYVQTTWAPNDPSQQLARPLAYQPHANGQPIDAPSWIIDNDDAATMRDYTCLSLRDLEGDTDRCD